MAHFHNVLPDGSDPVIDYTQVTKRANLLQFEFSDHTGSQNRLALNRPNILLVYEIDTAEGVDFIAMEYVDGKPLEELIGHKGLALRETLNYAVQAADGLANAHAEGIVHRDGRQSLSAEGAYDLTPAIQEALDLGD